MSSTATRYIQAIDVSTICEVTAKQDLHPQQPKHNTNQFNRTANGLCLRCMNQNRLGPPAQFVVVVMLCQATLCGHDVSCPCHQPATPQHHVNQA